MNKTVAKRAKIASDVTRALHEWFHITHTDLKNGIELGALFEKDSFHTIDFFLDLEGHHAVDIPNNLVDKFVGDEAEFKTAAELIKTIIVIVENPDLHDENEIVRLSKEIPAEDLKISAPSGVAAQPVLFRERRTLRSASALFGRGLGVRDRHVYLPKRTPLAPGL
jgi:hypothetical protein